MKLYNSLTTYISGKGRSQTMTQMSHILMTVYILGVFFNIFVSNPNSFYLIPEILQELSFVTKVQKRPTDH